MENSNYERLKKYMPQHRVDPYRNKDYLWNNDYSYSPNVRRAQSDMEYYNKNNDDANRATLIEAIRSKNTSKESKVRSSCKSAERAVKQRSFEHVTNIGKQKRMMDNYNVILSLPKINDKNVIINETPAKLSDVNRNIKDFNTTPSIKINKDTIDKKNRAQKYKEYLDLQIQLKNEKREYEKFNTRRCNEVLKHKNNELMQLEGEIMVKSKQLQQQLAEVYQHQISEQKNRKLYIINRNKQQ